MGRDKVKKIALYGVLVALGVAFSYVEMLIPVFFAIPGIRIGLANIVILTALYTLGNVSAVTISVIRIMLVFFMFGNGMSLAYSFAGAFISLIVMITMKRLEKFSTITVSIAGAVSHNIGQILVAVFITNIRALYWYLIILWFVGILTGTLIGIIAGILIKRVKNIMQ